MILHLGYELPEKKEKISLGYETPNITETEADILRKQIRKNTGTIDSYIERLDLFVNKERYPGKVTFINRLRERLYLLMEENDTFRKVLWSYTSTEQ